MASKAPLIVSGIQPTGTLHIGNWAGSIRNWVELQDKHPECCLFFIADYHAMTIAYDPKEKQAQVLDLAASLLALGIDPKKSTLFVQSDVPETTELCWIFNTVTPVVEMERMTQFKDKSAHDAKNVNMGLFDYPVLQAADILLYGGNAVPVGRDQVQHVETTRVIARNFNKRFGSTFPEPEALLTSTPKVMSLTEPLKKMSKSHGPKSYIALDDEPEVIKQKVRKMVTATSGKFLIEKSEGKYKKFQLPLKFNPETMLEALLDEFNKDEVLGNQGVMNLFSLLILCYGVKGSLRSERINSFINTQLNLLESGGELKYGEFKDFLAEMIAEKFAEYRAKKADLLKNPDRIRMILANGGAKARERARKTMEAVHAVTGLR